MAQMITLQPKKVDVMIVHIDPWKVPMGHRLPFCGTGAHKDKRNRRKRTRQAQLAHAMKE